MSISSISDMLRLAPAHGRTVAVAAAHDDDVLKACAEARREQIARFTLTGDREKIEAILGELGEDPANYRILPAPDDETCAAIAAAEISAGRAEVLMKGLLSTAVMVKAVLHTDGLRTGRLLSHVMFYETAAYPRLLALTDGGVNTYPNLEQKTDILENCAILLKKLGYQHIHASCICGAETVSPKIQATVDADALAHMTERWAPYSMDVIGPVGLDLAISPAACRHKGYAAPGAGEADILLVPTYEVGNGIGKSMTYFAGAKSAGVVLGAAAPIVLCSRADAAETKLASLALGCLAVG
ncbi:MAG: phosphate acyltransferase [Clostridiaceae bacterium]|nr:phosphate acyltransferase [Clostridiaceae bacterium]